MTTFAAVFIAWFVGHSVGDHWVQTSCQAIKKGERTRAGRLACARHVATLTTTKLVLTALVFAAHPFGVNPVWFTTGVAVDGVAHYWADRRFTLERLAGRKLVNKTEFYHLGEDTVHQFNPSGSHLGTGKYALDQSWHHLWLLVGALIASV